MAMWFSLRPGTLLLAGALLASLLAGCAEPGAEADAQVKSRSGKGAQASLEAFDAEWADHGLPFGLEHNHRDASQHRNLSTPNFRVVGYDPLITDYYGETPGDYGCGSTVERDGRRLSVVETFTTDVSFVIADTTDPANPTKLGELALPNTQTYDITLTPDLNYVVLATSPLDSGPDAALPSGTWGTFRDACTGAELPVLGPEQNAAYSPGIVLVDVRNPRNPFVADFLPLPPWGHSIRAYEIDGRNVLLATIFNYVHESSYYAFLEVQETPAGPKMILLSMISSVQQDGELILFRAPTGGAHDGYLQRHPVTGELLAYLANGPGGLIIVNVDDLRNPVFVSQWKAFEELGKATPSDPYFHMTLPIEGLWDGRHYLFVGEECLTRRDVTPNCLMLVYDTTDPRVPKLVGAWTFPVDVEWTNVGLLFSVHHFILINRTLFVTTFHGGVWAIDVSTFDKLQTMPSIGLFVPDRDSPKPPSEPHRAPVMASLMANYVFSMAPIVADIDATSDGHLVTFEGASGLYVLKFDETNPAPAPEPWPALPWSGSQ